MKNPLSPFLQSALTHTAIIVGAVILHSIVADIAGIYFSVYNSIAGVVLPFIGISYVIYAYRTESCDNVITYSKALGYGSMVALFYGVLMSLFQYIHLHEISPDLLEMAQVVTEEKLIKRGLSDAQIETAIEQGERFKSFGWSMLFGTLAGFLFGFIFSLIAAAFLKKEPKNPFEGVE
ncbi:MAG: DUF4199 domain-containing protein [Bacteroidales bacterium]|nr:DUF4199 domain-containing protein [Bacteroidales bacterium]